MAVYEPRPGAIASTRSRSSPQQPARSRYASSARSSWTSSERVEHEAVRLEGPTEVLVGERARVRRVAGPLEAVQLEPSSGSIGEIWSAMRSVPPRRVTRASSAMASSGRATWWSTLRVPLRSNQPSGNGSSVTSPSTKRHVGIPIEALASLLEQLRDELDRHDLSYERRQREGQSAGAGAGVERALVAGQFDQMTDARRELLGTVVRAPPTAAAVWLNRDRTASA